MIAMWAERTELRVQVRGQVGIGPETTRGQPTAPGEGARSFLGSHRGPRGRPAWPSVSPAESSVTTLASRQDGLERSLQWIALVYVATVPLDLFPFIAGRSVAALMGLVLLICWVTIRIRQGHPLPQTGTVLLYLYLTWIVATAMWTTDVAVTVTALAGTGAQVVTRPLCCPTCCGRLGNVPSGYSAGRVAPSPRSPYPSCSFRSRRSCEPRRHRREHHRVRPGYWFRMSCISPRLQTKTSRRAGLRTARRDRSRHAPPRLQDRPPCHRMYGGRCRGLGRLQERLRSQMDQAGRAGVDGKRILCGPARCRSFS